MRTVYIILYVCAVQLPAWTQVWPSAALVHPEAGAPPAARGRISADATGAWLTDDQWKDYRYKLNIDLGIARDVGLRLSTSTRDLSGLGAFQRGTEDTRTGLAVWPVATRDRHLRLGINTNFVIPTGYRKQESYYDSTSSTGGLLPSFSLDQTAGELYGAMEWTPGRIAKTNAFGGYFASSDRSEQAFRWGAMLELAPFGHGAAAELGFAQSFTRVGSLPNTQVLTSGLAIRFPWNLQVAPGFTAELTEEPTYGASISLRLDAPLPKHLFPVKSEPVRSHYQGAVLLPPPTAKIPVADKSELWKTLQEQTSNSFSAVRPLNSLDLPGLPFDDSNISSFWNSVQAVAAANFGARWLLVTEIEREEISPAGGFYIPLLISRPEWSADLTLRAKLIDLNSMDYVMDRRIIVHAVRAASMSIPLFSDGGEELLTIQKSRLLMLDAYEQAGRELMLGGPNVNSNLNALGSR